MKTLQNNIFSKCAAIIFDMDGVIVDSEPIHGESFRIFLEELKVPYTEEFVNNLVGHSVNHNIKTINETYLQHRPLDIEEGIRSRDTIYFNLITTRSLKPIEGIEDLISKCKDTGIKLGLASSSVREQIDAILKSLTENSTQGINFQTVFDATVGGDEVSNKKPAPDIYKKAIQILDINNDYCIAIEDSGAGILSAKANGIFCIALKNQYLKQKEALAADMVINSIKEVVNRMNSVPE
jgi:beta-phosphoglucomutase-like phosphatase (HAD superfamily)